MTSAIAFIVSIDRTRVLDIRYIRVRWSHQRSLCSLFAQEKGLDPGVADGICGVEDVTVEEISLKNLDRIGAAVLGQKFEYTLYCVLPQDTQCRSRLYSKNVRRCTAPAHAYFSREKLALSLAGLGTPYMIYLLFFYAVLRAHAYLPLRKTLSLHNITVCNTHFSPIRT